MGFAAEPTTDENDQLFVQSARLILDGDYEQALNTLLMLMQKDRSFRDDGARKAILSVFDMLGDDPMIKQYRGRMFNIMH